MKSGKPLDLSGYKRMPRDSVLIDRHSIPVTKTTKDRISAIKPRFDINKALRDYLEQVLDFAEKSI